MANTHETDKFFTDFAKFTLKPQLTAKSQIKQT